MRRGEITVECSSAKCHAEAVYEAAALETTSLSDLLLDDGWMRVDGKDICQDCINFAVAPYDPAREERL